MIRGLVSATYAATARSARARPAPAGPGGADAPRRPARRRPSSRCARGRAPYPCRRGVPGLAPPAPGTMVGDARPVRRQDTSRSPRTTRASRQAPGTRLVTPATAPQRARAAPAVGTPLSSHGLAGKERADVNAPLEWTDLDRPRRRHRARAGGRRRREGRQRPPRHRDQPRPAAYLLYQRVMRHDPTDPTGSAATASSSPPGTRASPSTSSSTWPGYGLELSRPRGAAHLGLADPRPPRVRPHQGRRDHHRTARPGHRQLGRLRHGRPARARPARPRRGPGHEPVRPLRVRHRLRRRPPGGRQLRGLVDRRHPEARQPRRDLGRQHDLDRGPHRHRVHRGRRWRATRPTAGTPSRWTGRTVAPATARTSSALHRGDRGGQGRHRQAVVHPRCARSSPGRRPPSRTPTARTAPSSAPRRSRA